MKTLRLIFSLVILTSIFGACSRSYDMPELTKPEYTGPTDKLIGVAELKAKYADALAADRALPVLIEEPIVLEAFVSSSDRAGNVFKQIFVQDKTGGIVIGIDENDLYTLYDIGQKVYVDLEGLYMVKYAGQIQIGFSGTAANRIAPEIAKQKIHRDGFAKRDNVVPRVITDLSNIPDEYVHTLVTFENVKFEEPGLPLVEKEVNVERYITNIDGTGRTMIRTSGYAQGLSDVLTPEGVGTITALMGKYNTTWQLSIRDKEDIGEFKKDGGETPQPEDKETLFLETFNKINAADRPTVSAATGFDNGAPVEFSATSDRIDIRATNTIPAHVWIPSNEGGTFAIKNIPLNGKVGKMTVSYKIAANLFIGTPIPDADLANVKLKVNGVDMNIPSHVVTDAAKEGNKFFTISTVANVTSDVKTMNLEFTPDAAKNIGGFRLDDIKIVMGGDGEGENIVPDPGEGGDPKPDPEPEPTTGYSENFGDKFSRPAEGWPKVGAFTGYEAKAPIVYSDPTGKADIRNTATMDNHVWLPADNDVSLVIDGIETDGATPLTLTYEIAANLFVGTALPDADLGTVKVSVNGQAIAVPSQIVTDAAKEGNKFFPMTFDIPASKTVKVEFSAKGTDNKGGFRLDNIKVTPKK